MSATMTVEEAERRIKILSDVIDISDSQELFDSASKQLQYTQYRLAAAKLAAQGPSEEDMPKEVYILWDAKRRRWYQAFNNTPQWIHACTNPEDGRTAIWEPIKIFPPEPDETTRRLIEAVKRWNEGAWNGRDQLQDAFNAYLAVHPQESKS